METIFDLMRGLREKTVEGLREREKKKKRREREREKV